MRKTSIALLVAWAAVSGALSLALNGPAGEPDPTRATEICGEPLAEVPAVLDRVARKNRLMERLIAGELRLAEAAEAVIALNREWPRLSPESYQAYAGSSLAARVAHMLANAVEHRLTADDPRREEVLRRLSRELGDIAAAEARSPTA
jgi:hypothetical protein